jgi:hypothetical protein
MERCVASARAAGVFKEFHVLAEQEIPGCECYDAMEVDLNDSIFKLIYLKTAISKLHFDYYIWVDADTVFTRNPDQLLATLGKGPIHVPLAGRVEELTDYTSLRGLAPVHFQEVMRKAGLYNEVYSSRSAFWIVKRAAVDVVFELSQHYYAVAKASSEQPHGDAALSYAMQMLCADPQSHLSSLRPDLWWSDEAGTFQSPGYDGWNLREPLAPQSLLPSAALVHLPAQRRQAMTARTGLLTASFQPICT